MSDTAPPSDTAPLLANLDDDGEPDLTDAQVTALTAALPEEIGTVDTDEPLTLEDADWAEVTAPPEDWDDDDEDSGFGTLLALSVYDLDAEAPGTRSGVNVLGFPASATASKIDVRPYRVPGTTVVVPVAASVAPLLIGFLADVNRLVEPLHAGWCWGWAYRLIRNASTISRHAPGIAVDINAPLHPMGKVDTWTPRQQAILDVLAHKYGLRLGMNYSGRRDDMHAEINEIRPAALARVQRLQARPASAPIAQFYPTIGRLRYRNTHSHVGVMVKKLAALGFYTGRPTNFYDWEVRKALAAFQRRQGWRGQAALGLMTPVTYQRLFGRKP